MCDNLATTKEHVPPKCLFPEKKDLKDISLDLRKALIKAPSCVDHNCKKSGDDEYLFNVLSMTIQTGKCQRHFKIDPFYLKNGEVKLTPLISY